MSRIQKNYAVDNTRVPQFGNLLVATLLLALLLGPIGYVAATMIGK